MKTVRWSVGCKVQSAVAVGAEFFLFVIASFSNPVSDCPSGKIDSEYYLIFDSSNTNKCNNLVTVILNCAVDLSLYLCHCRCH